MHEYINKTCTGTAIKLCMNTISAIFRQKDEEMSVSQGQGFKQPANFHTRNLGNNVNKARGPRVLCLVRVRLGRNERGRTKRTTSCYEYIARYGL
jgi:hypothetical protein